MNADHFKADRKDGMNARTWPSVLVAGALLVLPGLVMAAPDKTESATQRAEQKINHAKSEAKADMAAAAAQVKDSWVTAKTKIALFGDDRVKGTQVNVETNKGVVRLRGMVDSDKAKKAAEEIATGTEHVKSVKNELQVVAPRDREAVEENDEHITKHVKQHLEKDARLRKADIDVTTTAGVVSLTGEVPDIMTSAQASWTAWNVPSVKSVKNDLTLKEKK